MSDSAENRIFIQSLAFGNEAVEVTYIEGRDADQAITEIRTLVIPGGAVPDELAEVVDSIEQLVDRALVIRRAPPERIRHGR